MKPVISPEWQKKAEEKFKDILFVVKKDEAIDAQIELVEAYASSVEKMLKDKIEKYKVPQDVDDIHTRAWYIAKTNLLQELLSELKTIKPL